MVATKQTVGVQDNYYAGDALQLTITVTQDGSAKDLSNVTTEWALSSSAGETELLNEGDSGVSSTVTDAPNGEVSVTLDSGVTDDFVGQYEHELRITEGGGNPAVVTRGRVIINERVNQ